MNKFIAALIAGLFAVSVNAIAADAPKVDAKPAAEAAAKPAAEAAVKADKPVKKAHKSKKAMKKKADTAAK